MIEVLDLFSAAAGGWSLGMHRAGFRTMAACEVEAWRRALYSENNPGVKVYDDVQTLTADRLLADLGRLPDIVVGSPPCQDISSANTKGKGVEGARSSLYFDAVRLVGECRPRWFAFENSSNLRTRGADAILSALEGIGYACWPVVVRAGDIGANHERPRCWLIGCDLAQVADADGLGWHEGRGRRWSGLDVSVPQDFGDAEEDGRGSRFSRGCAEPAEGLSVAACGHAAYPHSDGEFLGALNAEMGELQALGDHRGGNAAPDASGLGYVARPGDDEGPGREADGHELADHAASSGAGRNTPHPHQARQARQAHGCMEPGLRQEEIADDGCGAGRGDDESGAGQMAVCPANRRDADGRRADWSLDDLADHIRLDDGLSAWLAGTRVAVGDGKGQSAASLVVEAFGDAVVPQIPEAIGRAILRTEAALDVVYGRAAA